MGSIKSEISGIKSEIGSLKSEMVGMKSKMDERFNSVDERFDAVDAKLDGMGNQFELTNEPRINEVDFLDNKVNRLEKEIFIMKSKSNS
ncbi:hypothetical protein FZC75_17510 [Sutcliffiella horikoshii]|uniref:Uncharacterized protein n=1 Tax=Sutcliffiella horikoshii TaxID=79883 RepID=A0A5D4T154_9BACI|nr:hypothetical protein FZC75_17510 [Sutcliffiella horikoshii]